MADTILNQVIAPSNIIGWGTQFNFPGFPIEKNKLFETYSDALAYAKGSDSYVGNIISIVNDEVIGEVTYSAGAYRVTAVGENGSIEQVGKDTDLSGVEGRLDSLESYATDQVSTYQELTSTYNAGKILYLTTDVNNGLEGDEKVEYLAGAYISLGNGHLQKLSTSDAGGATPEDRLTALETSVNNIQADIYSDGKLNVYTKSEVESQINSKISGVYRFKGSKYNTELPTTGNAVGDVYNVLDNFQLGEVSYPAGTNVVWTGDDSKWDALAGITDYSGVYAEKEHTHTVKDITDLNLATVATSGNYSDLTGLPTIPTAVADLTDASDYAKTTDVTINAIKVNGVEITPVEKAVDIKLSDVLPTGAQDGQVLTASVVEGEVTISWEDPAVATTIAYKEDGVYTIESGDVSADVYTTTKVDALLSGKADSATTIAGYGITDAYTKTETDNTIKSALAWNPLTPEPAAE